MTLAIFDTNVLIQAIIGSPAASSAQAVRAYREGRCRLVFSAETLGELETVLILPNIRMRHGWSDDELRTYVRFLLARSLFVADVPGVPVGRVRDITDTKFLALAELARPQFLVTNDRRDLVPLKTFGSTVIVTPGQFVRQLT